MTELEPDRLVEAFGIILAQAAGSGRVRADAVNTALGTLIPLLDPEAVASWRDRVEVQEPRTEATDDPTLVVAELSDDELDRAYKATLADPLRAELPTLLRHVPPPERWLEPIMEHIIDRRREPYAELPLLDSVLAAHTALHREQSALWYLRLLVRPERPAISVVRWSPHWVASLHTEAELAQVSDLLATHL